MEMINNNFEELTLDEEMNLDGGIGFWSSLPTIVKVGVGAAGGIFLIGMTRGCAQEAANYYV